MELGTSRTPEAHAPRGGPAAEGAEAHEALAIENLLEERAFLRRLALDLARSSEEADELEQQVWLRVLQRPPRHGRELRAWLARILRNVAITNWTASRRRKARECEVVAHRRPPTPLELAEQRGIQAGLARGLSRLNEQYAEAVRLRYLEDLPPRRIAALQNVSVDTVQSRLRRGLDQLRTSLDGEYGERRNWSLALLAWAGLRPRDAAAGSLSASGSVAMAGALLLVLGSAAVWSVTRERDEQVARSPR